MRGTCDGAPLFTLFSSPGILTDTIAACALADARSPAMALRQAPIGRWQPPDPPPPRS